MGVVRGRVLELSGQGGAVRGTGSRQYRFSSQCGHLVAGWQVGVVGRVEEVCGEGFPGGEGKRDSTGLPGYFGGD